MASGHALADKGTTKSFGVLIVKGGKVTFVSLWSDLIMKVIQQLLIRNCLLLPNRLKVGREKI